MHAFPTEESVVYGFDHDVMCKHGRVIGQYDTEYRHWAILKTETQRTFQASRPNKISTNMYETMLPSAGLANELF